MKNDTTLTQENQKRLAAYPKLVKLLKRIIDVEDTHYNRRAITFEITTILSEIGE